MKIPIGVANSISANFDYDPLDTLQFAVNEGFELLQVYLNQTLLSQTGWFDTFQRDLPEHMPVIFHAEGDLNDAFFTSPYYHQLQTFLNGQSKPRYVVHFDESIQVDRLVDMVEQQVAPGQVILLENYFRASGPEAAEKNIKKFMALFTLLVSGKDRLLPVLDIPRFFHAQLQWAPQQALNWVFQLINFFSLRRIPILLHLVDYADHQQQRHQFCPVGEGHIPYEEFFTFLRKTRPPISGIILEYEDKLNPLKSRQNIRRWLD